MKVLIISTNAGDGHDAAANALAATAPAGVKTLVWHLEDFLKPWQTFLLVVSYRYLVTNFQGIIWRGLYNFAQTDRGYNWFKWLVYICPGSTRKICTAILAEKPDVVITTHFYTPIFLEKIINPPFKLFEVVTDYGWHRLWYHPNILQYFISSELIKNGLLAETVPSTSINLTGIPIKPIFHELKLKSELRADISITPDRPMVLIMTGGTGLVPADEYLRELIPYTTEWSIVVIAGKNKKLRAKLEKIKKEKNLTTVTILGWTDKPADYIRAADVIITKPGGLTTSECAAAGKPMILVSPIPGQEENNAEHFTKLGLALHPKNNSEIVPAVKHFLNQPLQHFANKKPPAAELIWREISKNESL